MIFDYKQAADNLAAMMFNIKVKWWENNTTIWKITRR